MKRVLAAAILLVFLAGCATRPYRSGRRGALDRRGGAVTSQDIPIPSREEKERGVEPVPSSTVRPITQSWRWPLTNVSVTSKFGPRASEFHEGVDLAARRGTAVYAAAGGKVIYASNGISGYGNLVVIRHGQGLSTVYAHNSRLLVRKGQSVTRGQRIAISGASGHVSGPHLHFEIRQGTTPVDPLAVMGQESRRYAAARETMEDQEFQKVRDRLHTRAAATRRPARIARRWHPTHRVSRARYVGPESTPTPPAPPRRRLATRR